MPDIKFIKDYTVRDGSGTVHKEGTVLKDLNDASANHFISRKAAVLVTEKPKVSAKKEVKKTEPKETNRK